MLTLSCITDACWSPKKPLFICLLPMPRTLAGNVPHFCYAAFSCCSQKCGSCTPTPTHISFWVEMAVFQQLVKHLFLPFCALWLQISRVTNLTRLLVSLSLLEKAEKSVSLNFSLISCQLLRHFSFTDTHCPLVERLFMTCIAKVTCTFLTEEDNQALNTFFLSTLKSFHNKLRLALTSLSIKCSWI